MVQVAKPALITLKRADQVIAMPALPVAQQITGWLPVESILISRGVVIEPIIGVRHVAGAAPHRITSIPRWPGGRKVGAEEAGHVVPDCATDFAPADPIPELLRIV
jgi:hypothetical protein